MRKRAYIIFHHQRIISILSGFHQADWNNKLSYLNKFKDKRFHYFGKKLLYQEKPDLLPKEDYDEIHEHNCKKSSFHRR